MTYSPNPLTHTQLADRTALWCSADGTYCSEKDPCLCDREPEAEPAPDESEVSYVETEPFGLVHHVADGDTGTSGESAG